MMESSLLKNDIEIQEMQDFQRHLKLKTVSGLDEQLQLQTVKKTTRIWRQDNRMIGFAFIDDFSNLWLEVEPGISALENLENEVVDWGVMCIKAQSSDLDDPVNLDSTCGAENKNRIEMLTSHDFRLQEIRTLHYSRSLETPIEDALVPMEFSIRSVKGIEEVETLVALHRAAFGTTNMTIEQRLAMMNVPNYNPDLDIVLMAPNRELAAFCVCSIEADRPEIGNLEIIGSHPDYRTRGFGKVIGSEGLNRLKRAGASWAELGTSSENLAMQKLALDLGFKCVSEQLWFSKQIK
jgi:mycothiol synthase